ncbi:Trace amine-associated receptor 9 [Stylophora pistillata]|uniref:Trace amine-associated receptor 9 n=1 Tax=Stylophora pistillata TaxID=50429 RepID=A0A2B4SQC5_STYPI|nr:Trace amine-associated receptor 9 [Stylophora pistillata]
MSTINLVSNIQEDDISTLRTSRLINSILNAICSFPAAFGNGIILIVIWRTPSLHSPSNTLLFGLALTDFLVGLVTQPLKVTSSVVYLESDEEGPITLALAFDVLSVVSSGSSFMIATAISVDRRARVQQEEIESVDLAGMERRFARPP